MANYNVSYKIDATGNLTQVNQTAVSINKNMKEAATAASGLGKAAGGALQATRARTTEREYERARGVTGQTGASGRDFAKQAEGLGGLVRLYATFAANIFAVTQAFEVLKRSFQFEQLQRASEAFAVTTGKNLSGIAKELRVLSDGALTAKAAQQFANYGQSAGFTADQMRRLVGVARGASQALGRDFSDAIDRLIRGTGKLEPELLDEIGLLTRTKSAGEEYAKSIGKTFDQLTQFEKVQAFTNAVIAEGERKFGAVAKAVPVSAFERFSAAAIDAGTSLANFINKGIVPLLDLLSQNPGLIIAGIIAAIAKLATTALPLLTNLSARARAAAKEQADAIEGKQEDAARAAKAASDTRIAAINSEKTAFLAAEEAKIKALNKTAQAAMQERGQKPGQKGTAVQTSIASVQVGEYEKLRKIQSTVTSQIQTQTKAIERLKIANQTASAEQVVSNKREIATRTESLALLHKQDSMLKAITFKQAEYNRLLAQEGAITASNTVQFNTAEIAKAKGKIKDLYSSIVNIAGQKVKGSFLAPFSEAFKTLGTQSAILGKEATSAGGKLDWLAGKFPKLTGLLQKFATTSIFAGGALRILGVAAVGLFTGVLPLIGIITTLGFAFDFLVGALGGWSEKIGAAKESNETLAKANEIASKQIVYFDTLLIKNTGTLKEWANITEYSSSALGAIGDNLDKASKDMKDFELAPGAVSKAWQSFLSLFGEDLGSKFGYNVKNAITNAMSVTNATDKAKIEKAILSLFPDARTIEEALGQFDKLNTVSKAFRGQQVAAEIAKVNQELKFSSDNLKSAVGGWEKLGESLDEYNKKSEVKDPKLKDTVDSLRSIEKAYSSAKTEADKVRVLSGATAEQVDKIVKLGKERNIDTSAFVGLIEQAKIKNQQLVDIQQEQARKQKQLAIDAAQALINQVNGYDFGAMDQVKDAQTAYQEFIAETERNPPKTVEDVSSAKSKLQKVSEAYVSALEEASKKANAVQRAGLMHMIEEVTKKYPELGELLGASLASGIQKGLRTFTPETMKLFSEFRAIENAQGGPGRGASASKEQIEKAEKANKDALANLADRFAATNKITEAKAKLARFYDLEIKREQQVLEILKQKAAIQQQAVGYISSATSAAIEAQQIAVIEKQYQKELAEIEKVKAKNKGDQKEFALQQVKIDELSKDIADTTKTIAIEAVKTESIRTQIVRERVQYEKEVLEFKRLSLDIDNQLLEAARSINIIDENGAAIAKAELSYQGQLLDMEKKRADLRSRQKALDAGQAADSETQATINAEERLLKYIEQRAKLTRDLTIEQAKYNEYLAKSKADLEDITENLNQQLNFTVPLASSFDNQKHALDQIDLLARDIVIQFEALPKSQQTALNLENMLLATANKVLETKKQIYELNAKEGSGADFADTVRQGIEVANLEYAKTTKSLAKTTVDALVGAIDTTVDALFDKLKSGAKVSLKEILKAGTDFVKNAMLDFVAQNIKTYLRDSLAGLFGGQSAEQQQKQAIDDLKKSIEANSKSQDLMRKPIETLTGALGSLENTIKNWRPDAGGSDSSAIPGFMVPGGYAGIFDKITNSAVPELTTSLMEGSRTTDTFADIISYATKASNINAKANIENAQVIGEATKSVMGLISSIGSGGGGGLSGAITGILGSIGKIFGNSTGGISSAFQNLFGGGGSDFAPGEAPGAFTGSAAGGGFGALMGGASTGAAVGALAAGLFGNERNSQGMQLGGTIGGIAGAALTPILGPLGPLIGSALGSALGSLWKSGGGPKSGGFAQSGEGFGRFFTPSDKDSELLDTVNNISSTYDKVIRSLGGSGKANFALGFDTDPKGTANSRVTAGVMVNGRQIQSTTEAGRSAEELTKELEAASSRLLLTAIRESDLPENVAAYYAGLTDDVIKTLSKEEVDKKLDFGSVLGTIAKSRDKIAEIFGEDLYNLTEEGLSEFQQGTERLSETFARLTAEFSITSRVVKFFGADVKSVFGTVGLASAEMRNQLIEGAGGLQAFTEQFNYFYENFYTDLDRAGFEFASAGETIRNGFRALNMDVPVTMADYRRAVREALQAGNIELYNSLMELAPAFDAVRGAIEDVASSINEASLSFLDRIDAETSTAEERYKKLKGLADGAQAQLDEIMRMSPEALQEAVQAGTISPAIIEQISSSALSNAEAAWSLLSDEQKQIMGGEFSTFVTRLNSNTTNVLEAISAAMTTISAAATGATDPAQGPTTSSDVVPPDTAELLATVPERTASALNEAFTTGSTLLSDSIISAFSTVNLPSGFDTESANLDLGLEEAQRAREEQQLFAQQALEETKRINEENRAAAFAEMADKLLGAANGMLSAAASMQAAASTPQSVNVTVQTLDDNVNAEVGVN